MKAQFFSLAARLEQDLASSETLLCNVSAERSDFIRFNKARVRQAGSVYRHGDQAVKTSYAGFDWDAAALAGKMAQAGERLELLALPRRTIEPGEYRAYLAPAALNDIVGLLGWGGFSARARQTKQSP